MGYHMQRYFTNFNEFVNAHGIIEEPEEQSITVSMAKNEAYKIRMYAVSFATMAITGFFFI